MSVTDISNPTGLKPKAEYFEAVGDVCINMDGVIEICRKTDTPAAKAVWRMFRKRHAQFRKSMQRTAPEKIREEAMLAALQDAGVKISFRPIKGTMEDQ